VVRQLIRVVIVFAGLPVFGVAQEAPKNASDSEQIEDLSDAVVSIATMKVYGPAVVSWMATGFCLDQGRQFVVTNYHVAEIAKPKGIVGEKVVEQHLGTSEKDDGATWNTRASLPVSLKFTPSRDLAIFKLRHALPHRHGLDFETKDLCVGDEVDIYAYPKESLSPISRRRLLRFHGRFTGETDKGLLAFSYDLTDGKGIRPGASGGIVVLSSTRKIAGVLSAIATDTQRGALAVPVGSLIDLVNKDLPLRQRLFPATGKICQNATDLYPKLVPPPHASGLERRSEEPAAIKVLRSKAQSTAEHMDDLIAVQTFTGGAGNRPLTEEKAYEVRFVDGEQRFCEYPNGTKEIAEVPYPAPLGDAVKTTNAWSARLLLIGT
jgi:Trypsin-like peptidase domain